MESNGFPLTVTRRSYNPDRRPTRLNTTDISIQGYMLVHNPEFSSPLRASSYRR